MVSTPCPPLLTPTAAITKVGRFLFAELCFAALLFTFGEVNKEKSFRLIVKSPTVCNAAYIVKLCSRRHFDVVERLLERVLYIPYRRRHCIASLLADDS